MPIAERPPASSTAVLFSGGLDSAVLLAQEAEGEPGVQPVYVSTGLAWEAGELAMTERLLAVPPFLGRVAPLERLTFSVEDVYPPSHWAIRGTPPAYDTPDEDVYLVGRNLLLLAKAGVLCARRRIGRLVLGPLAGNPFPDATPEFFETMARALSIGLAHEVTVATPLSQMHKADVIRIGAALHVPFELTLSCMNPREGRHCGACSKCRERHDAFAQAGMGDPTQYAAAPPR